MKKVIQTRKRSFIWKISDFNLNHKSVMAYSCVVCGKRTDKPHVELYDKRCLCSMKCMQQWS